MWFFFSIFNCSSLACGFIIAKAFIVSSILLVGISPRQRAFIWGKQIRHSPPITKQESSWPAEIYLNYINVKDYNRANCKPATIVDFSMADLASKGKSNGIFMFELLLMLLLLQLGVSIKLSKVALLLHPCCWSNILRLWCASSSFCKFSITWSRSATFEL